MRLFAGVADVVPVVSLTVAVACGGSAGETARDIVTEPVHYLETGNRLAGADLGREAIAYVLDTAEGLSGDDDLVIVGETTTPGLRHVRLQQTHRGVPVDGSIVIAHADDTTFVGWSGYLTRGLDGFDVTPLVTADAALAAAEADHAGGATVAYSEPDSALVLLPGDDGIAARLAWLVRFRNAAVDASIGPGWWNYYIDAGDGRVLVKFNNLETAVLQASGPGGNAKRSRTWSSELDVAPSGSEYLMDTDRQKTLDNAHGDAVVKGTDLANMTDPIANDGHGHTEITLAMMRDWMGRDSIDDKGMEIVTRVHVSNVCTWGPNNACWDGTKLNMGQGGAWGSSSQSFYEWAGALDAVGHELNHGFTQHHSALVYKNQSGALNESFSDVAGTIAEFYHEGESADFLMFEDIWSGEAFRYMCDPGKDGTSIGDAADFKSSIDVHYSSGVPNRAFCLAVARYKAATGISSTVAAVAAMGHVWYAANAAYWTSGTSWVEACRGTVDAARALGYPSGVIEGLGDSWADVGAACDITTTVCDGDSTCDAAAGETCASCPDDCGACGDTSEHCSTWKKAKCKIGIGDCSKCNLEPACGDGICAGNETDENCGEDCGCGALECEQVAPYGCFCDDVCRDYDDCCADRDVCE